MNQPNYCLVCGNTIYSVKTIPIYARTHKYPSHKLGYFCPHCKILFYLEDIAVFPYLEKQQFTLEGIEK
jgi:hypothetical protein